MPKLIPAGTTRPTSPTNSAGSTSQIAQPLPPSGLPHYGHTAHPAP
ncbi:hypothetical protein [Streptomyces laculatispora]|nr:hypothetical protein [Streptomyces laculatispora]MBO0918474.1 hypothetical protein [Streptomyces laculatispora]